jgi:hypothetical protein
MIITVTFDIERKPFRDDLISTEGATKLYYDKIKQDLKYEVEEACSSLESLGYGVTYRIK